MLLSLDLTTVFTPLDPTTGEFSDGATKASLASEGGGGATADAGLAVKDDMVVVAGPGDAESLLELVGR